MINMSGVSPGQGHNLCCILQGKTCYPHSDSLHIPGVQMVPVNCQGNLTKSWWVTCNGLAPTVILPKPG